MKPPRYEQAYSDEWFSLPTGVADIACCGCSLVHEVHARVRGGKIELRFDPNARKTAALRREEARRSLSHSK